MGLGRVGAGGEGLEAVEKRVEERTCLYFCACACVWPASQLSSACVFLRGRGRDEVLC